MPNEPLTLLAAFIIGTIAVARVTRLLYHDAFPPIEDLRLAFINWCNRGTYRARWGMLAVCPFCLAFWVAVVDLTAATWSGLHPVWWWVNVLFAVAYLAPILIVRDEPADPPR